jgi:hemerythrin-like domain-containing protein
MSKSATRRAASKPSHPRSSDALGLLRADHKEVLALFARFEKARDEQTKEQLARTICEELKVHAQLEEEIFYPAIRDASNDDTLLDEALVEHQSAKDLIAQIERADSGSSMFEAMVTVLGEYIRHHVKEEQGPVFTAARQSGLDRRALGERLQARKQELKSAATGSVSPERARAESAGAGARVRRRR